MRFKDKYFLYYTIMYQDINSIDVGIAVSDDMENWSHSGEIPIEYDL